MGRLSWAIRVTFANGREAFVRRGGVIGRGPIATYYTKAAAEDDVRFLREGFEADDVITIIERSHGRRTDE